MSIEERTTVSSTAWLLQRLTGIGLIVLLGFHFAVEHFIVGAHNIKFDNTQARMAEGLIHGGELIPITIDLPALLYQAIAILLLAFSIEHGLYGTYNILTEQNLSRGTEKVLKYVFVIGGIALFVQGLLIFQAFTDII